MSFLSLKPEKEKKSTVRCKELQKKFKFTVEMSLNGT